MSSITTQDKETTCWICGRVANSAEHVFKARHLKRFFDQGGYGFDAAPLHFHSQGYNRIPGPKSKRMKYSKLICSTCNSEATSDFDRTYDRLFDWFMTQQNNYAITHLNFREIFGAASASRISAVRRYCAKSLGCRILASGAVLPSNFPNPVTGLNISLLQFSICRSEPFRNFENYKPNLLEKSMGKGSLHANLSRSYLENTGQKKVLSAVWWENIGHFQVNYWFNIDVNTELGQAVMDLSELYMIIHSDLSGEDMTKAMATWLREH